MNIQDIYRAHHVDRWQIVNVSRTQSLAEHSFNVAMIAREIAIRIGLTSHLADITEWALIHDLPEIATGDIASPLKVYMRNLGDGEDGVEKLESRISKEYRVTKKAVRETVVNDIVKLADLIDGIRYLELYANKSCIHARETLIGLRTKLQSKVAELKTRTEVSGVFNWDEAMKVWADLSFGKPKSIDSILKEDSDAQEK